MITDKKEVIVISEFVFVQDSLEALCFGPGRPLCFPRKKPRELLPMAPYHITEQKKNRSDRCRFVIILVIIPIMIASRFFRASQQIRTLSKENKKILKRKDVDYWINPEERYVDAFMKWHGKDRAVFKKDDISLWQKSFGDAYKFKLMCLKGTDTMVACDHSCEFEPLDPLVNEPITFIGLGWIEPKFRKMKAAVLVGEDIAGSMRPGANVSSNINTNMHLFWKHLCGDRDSNAHMLTLNTGYNSFYKAHDVFLPQNIPSEGITVKNARDVSPEDMTVYDQKIHPYHREKYMISHMLDKDGFGKVAFDPDGNVIGMAQAVIYPAGDCNLGPVYGDNPRVVQTMFAEILKDIGASGKKITHFEVRTIDKCEGSDIWIKPFLKCKPKREVVCGLAWHKWKPKNVDFSKVYSPTHAQLFLI